MSIAEYNQVCYDLFLTNDLNQDQKLNFDEFKRFHFNT
jgi:hypothetical protein